MSNFDAFQDAYLHTHNSDYAEYYKAVYAESDEEDREALDHFGHDELYAEWLRKHWR